MRSIAVLNQKGGVGKTTSTVNLGAGLAERGQRVLLLDLDPQAHLTLHLGLEPAELEYSVYDTLTAGVPLSKILVRRSEQLHIAPSHINLAGAEIELVNTIGRESLLRDAVAEVASQYDYMLIDCPPSLGMLSLNALVACQEVFVPLQTHFLAMQGMSQLLETVQLVNRRLNPKLRVSGIIFCQYDRRTSLSREVVEEVRSHFTPRGAGAAANGTSNGAAANKTPSGPTVFDTHIRQTVRLAEAPSFGKSIFEYDRSGPGSADYNRLVLEVLRQGGRPVDLNDPIPPKPGREPEEREAPEPAKPSVAKPAAAEPEPTKPAKPRKRSAEPVEARTNSEKAGSQKAGAEKSPSTSAAKPTEKPSEKVAPPPAARAVAEASVLPEPEAQPCAELSSLGDPGSILRCRWESEPVPVLPAEPVAVEPVAAAVIEPVAAAVIEPVAAPVIEPVAAVVIEPVAAAMIEPAPAAGEPTLPAATPPMVLEVGPGLPTALLDEDTVEEPLTAPPTLTAADAELREARLPSEGGCDGPTEAGPPSEDLAGLPDPELLSEAEEADFLAGLERELQHEYGPPVPAAAG